ncbi:MAG: Lrp/AsnC family transcriptional regulator [Firmicutes bacterium]|nr:Lrp/AsnC family transcriptional regulator [Bacillota bacterium]
MEDRLDALDQQLIEHLQVDGRVPYTALAAELGVAEATVRKRVNRLLDEGILKIVGVPSREKLGLSTQAIVGVKVDGDSVERVIVELQPLEIVRYIGVAAGEFDLILELAATSNEELFQFLTRTLRDIEGVVASQTSLIMKVPKKSF